MKFAARTDPDASSLTCAYDSHLRQASTTQLVRRSAASPCTYGRTVVVQCQESHTIRVELQALTPVKDDVASRIELDLPSAG